MDVRLLRDGGSQGAGSIAEPSRPGVGKPVNHRVACAQDPQEVQKTKETPQPRATVFWPGEADSPSPFRRRATFMSEYQRAWRMRRPGSWALSPGGVGGKRAPRLLAISSTAPTRLLNEMHKDAKPKKECSQPALDRVDLLAKKRGETVTE